MKWNALVASIAKKAKTRDPANEGTVDCKSHPSNKYSEKNLKYCDKMIANNLDGTERDLIAASLAKSTWATHATAMNCVEAFMKSSGSTLIWPIPLNVLCKFVSWACSERKLRAQTIRTYVSSLNTIHKLKCIDSQCNNYMVQTLIKGVENLELYSPKKESGRKVMTLPLLRVLGHQIATSDWSPDSKLTVWCACVTAFFGSFRLGEMLSRLEFSFNPTEILMWDDIKFRKDGSVLIHVKIDKCKNSGGSFVDLFPFECHGCCPVESLKRMKKDKFKLNSPVFMFANGKMLTQKILNSLIKQLLVPIFGDAAMSISGHSFRAGIASALASDPSVAMDRDIKYWGRWSSDSYLLYTKLKLNQKKILFGKIKSVLTKKDT
jgi:hypothetical protein